MSDHLPECVDAMIPDFHNERWVCICAALRSCEERVLDAALKSLYSMENSGGYPEFDFDHIRDDFRDVIDSLKEKK